MNTCPLCGEALTGVLRSAPGCRPVLRVRCDNPNCPIEAQLLLPADHQLACDALRREIVLHWTFDQCLARPCPATLTAALALLVEVAAVASFKSMRSGYCRFVSICWLPELNAVADALMHRLVPVNGGGAAIGGAA